MLSILTNLNPFTCLPYESLKNTVGKGEIASKEQFLLFSPVFSTRLENFCDFRQICHLQTLSIWKSKICPLGKGQVLSSGKDLEHKTN